MMTSDRLEAQYSLMGEQPLWASPERFRKGFIKKVYGILSLQLVATTLIAAPFVLNHVQVERFNWLFWMSMITSLTIMLLFACIPRLMREVPLNYILLAVFTIAEGLTVGLISSLYSTASVVMAFALVTAVSFALTLFATRTSTDFTKSFFPYLLAVSVVMIGAGFFLIFFPSQIGVTVYAAMGAAVFSVYLVFDTQMILGGKKEMQFTIDDYVPAAISLYVDIVSLFIYLLQLFGQRRDD